MTKSIGTALQAIKFANTLFSAEDAGMFVSDWFTDKVTTGYFYDNQSFDDWLKKNPDPVPEWYGKFDEQVISDCMSDALCNGEGRVSGQLLLDELESTGLKLVPIEKDRGDGRMSHYGSARQPLDDIIEGGLGPQFCAGNVLKYLRRDKEREDSIKKARWYWVELGKMTERDRPFWPLAFDCLRWLENLLTVEEKELFK